MLENLTPAERYERELERHKKGGIDWTPLAYKAAFHRTVVDHLATKRQPSIEGIHMLAQAEIVCAWLDMVTT